MAIDTNLYSASVDHSFTDVEKRYSQTEKDALGLYLQGAPRFKIITSMKVAYLSLVHYYVPHKANSNDN